MPQIMLQSIKITQFVLFRNLVKSEGRNRAMEEPKIIFTDYKDTPNTKLYQFLAVNYDICDIAQKIYAEKSFRKNILNLKKISEDSL